MNKLLLVLFLSLGFSVVSQICTIDNTQTVTGIYPDTLPVGYVGQPYSTDITFVMPLDTLGYDFTNFNIFSVSLPVGLSWQCNNQANGCNYNPQVSQQGCVNISGTPLLAGQYSVDVTVIADLTVIQGYPFTFQIFLEILPSNIQTTNDGFSMIGAAGCAPITVDFVNNNPGLLAYTWDFGNGNTSTIENPAPQVYSNPGEYIVQYEAFNNLDIIQVYTLTGLTINSMSNFGGGFPSYEDADAYFILKENGVSIYQSSIIGDTDPPVSWTTSVLLNPLNTYIVEIWEADDSFGEVLFGADDYMGNHTLNISGCNGCAAGTSTINYSIVNQTIYPSPIIISADTVIVYGYPAVPLVSYNIASNVLSTTDLGLAYQWYLNESPINGATNATHTVTQSGVYHVIAINQYGCVSFSDTVTGIYCLPNYTPAIILNANSELEIGNPMLDYTIQWFMNGTALPGENAQTLVTTNPGVYTVELIDSFGCMYSSNGFNANAGTAEISGLDWSIYPNPANDFVTIEINQNGLLNHVELVDLSGRVLRSDSWSNGSQVEINVADIPDGYYIIRLTAGSQRFTKQLIIN